MTPPLTLAVVRQRYTAFGGAERFLAQAMAALTAQGVAVTVVARRWQADGPAADHLPCAPFHLGRLWRDWGFARAACRLLAAHPFTLVQSHERIPCCDLYRAGDGVHRVWLANRRPALSPLARLAADWSPFHRYLLAAEWRLFTSPRLKAVICNSHMVRQEILDHFPIDPAKLRVIYSGVDLERFHPRLRERHRQAVRAQHHLPPAGLVLLFVGSGFARKGLPTLLAALPEHAYLLVAGRDRQQRAMGRLAQRLGCAERVRLLGPVADVAPLYGAADAVVLPTLYDPFPNVALEAMASGLPLVTTHQCGARDLIRDGENGLLCQAGEVTALRQALQRLQPAPFRQTMGMAARATVEPLSLTAMAERMTALYWELLHGKLAQ